MRKSALALLFLSCPMLVQAQPHHGGSKVLFLARAGPLRPADRQTSGPTATAAFIIDRRARTLSYDLTYQGLVGPPRSIALHNRGVGAQGPVVMVLCGAPAEPCPAESSARISAAIDRAPLEPRLLSEFASGRIYLLISPGDDREAIRGQLEPNGAMVGHREFVASLVPRPQSGGTGVGTAVMSETYLPNGKVEVEYSITVAGTRGRPTRSSIGSAPLLNPFRALRFSTMRSLPAGPTARAVRTAGPAGGSLNGRYVVTTPANKALWSLSNLFGQNRRASVVVQTDRFPEGELVGVFVPVN